MNKSTASLLIAAVIAGSGFSGPVTANPVTIGSPFLRLEHADINSLGFFTGQGITFGANNVIPNGAPGQGTTGLATTTNTVTSALVSRTINFIPSPLQPNDFIRSIPFNSQLLGPWTLTFTNGLDSSATTLDFPADAQLAPFVNSITLSGTSANPTFSWTPPPNTTVNGYRVNIYDKSLINLNPANGPLNTGQVVSVTLQPNVTSHTVTAGDFLVPGYGFTLGTNYSLEIVVLQTRDGSSTNLSPTNVDSTSRVYADFTPQTTGGPPVNLPVVLVNGAFQYDMNVQFGQTYYIDPLVATGYLYEIGAGDPNFLSVDLPVGIGDGMYDIYGFDASNNLTLLAHDWLGGNVFDFGGLGVSAFEVLGIEASAGLDPNNTTAFVTGLTFAHDGAFTGTQTPLTTTVPEPATLALLSLGLAGLGFSRRKH